MKIRLNKSNYRLCDIIEGKTEIKDVCLGRLLFLEIPTSPFKEEIGDGISLYVTKTKQVVINKEDLETIIIPQLSYIEAYRSLARIIPKIYKDIKPVEEYLNYKEFIGLFTGRSISKVIINTKGEVKCMGKNDNETNCVVMSKYDLKYDGEMTSEQNKTMRELKMRCIL